MTAAALAATIVVLIGGALRPLPIARSASPGSTPPVTPNTATSIRSTLRTSIRARHRPLQITPADVAKWCDDLAQATRSGSTIAAAVVDTDTPPSIKHDIDQVVLALRRGAPLSDAVTNNRQNNPHLGLAFSVLRSCARYGGPPSEPIERTAAILRARSADLADRRTQSAQARLSAIVMTVLPIAMLGLLLATSGSVRASVSSPAGLITLATGSLLNLVGWRWMSRIVNRGNR